MATSTQATAEAAMSNGPAASVASTSGPALAPGPSAAVSSSSSPLTLDTSDRSMGGCQVALQALQSKTIEALAQSVMTRHLVTTQMKTYLARLQLDVEKLRVIHVAGTKGKGSTSAFTERICRAQGLRTGLYTSPDLVHITERFRLDGHPISESVFLRHFWSVWDGLVQTADRAEGHPPIPSYFRFLTLVAYHLFLHHTPHVDVVILEVGIGGKLDATNIIERPIVCAITSVGYDHMEILGYAIEEIAHEKAGIIKPGVPVYSVASQAAEVKGVLREVAAAEKARLTFVDPADHTLELGLAGWHQYENAGLSIALATEFLRATGHPALGDLAAGGLPASFVTALKETSWPGRCQRLAHPNPQLQERVTFFIDGAHTDTSMKIACQWLQSQEPTSSAKRRHILLFNCGHIRDPIELMIPLVSMGHPCAAAAVAASSSGSTVAAASCPPDAGGLGQPIHFDRLICSPFDHDRPHLASAPTLEKLLTNYLLPHQRRKNTAVAVAAGSTDSASAVSSSSATPPRKASIDHRSLGGHIHPVLLRYLVDQFEFPTPPLIAADGTVESAQRCVTKIVAAYGLGGTAVHQLETFPSDSDAAPAAATPQAKGTTWQHTLFRVWHLLTDAFRYAEALAGHQSAQPAQCTYAASVHDALRGLQASAEKDETPMDVFVTGSLYIVGNVLRELDYRV